MLFGIFDEIFIETDLRVVGFEPTGNEGEFKKNLLKFHQ
jgi:hypothetical protein